MKTSANILTIGAAILLLASCTKDVVSPERSDMAAAPGLERPEKPISPSTTGTTDAIRPLALSSSSIAAHPDRPVVLTGPDGTTDPIGPITYGTSAEAQ